MRLTRSRPTIAVLLGFAAAAAAGAAVRPTAARIAEVAALLPAAPAPVGESAANRPAWEALAARVPLREITNEATRIAPSSPPAATDALYLEYSRTGSRSGFEAVYNSRRDRLTTFAWAEALENQGRFLAALQREVDAILEERSWTLPAHDANLDNFYGRVVEVDLGAAMRGWSLATIGGWFGEALGTQRLARLQSELRRRITDPYLNALRNGPRGGFWWVHTNSNWNAVCHAGVVGATLAAIPDRTLRAEVVAGAEANLPYFVAGFTDDGYCSEGIGYWSYGFGHHVLLAETVAAATGGRLRLLQGEKLARVTAFPAGMEILPRVYPAFSDNAPDVRPSSWVAPLARRLLDGATPPARLAAPGWTEVARDQLYVSAVRMWTPSVVAPAGAESEPQLRHWFADAQVLVARAATDFGAAIKGGHNDELHNHNDLGSFVIALGGTPLLVDPGSEVYTARTFSARRYDSKVLNSYGHPVPRVAGRLQGTGRSHAARVIATEFTRERDRLRLDLSGGYAVPELRRLERELSCVRGAGEAFTISDEVEFSSPQEFGVALVTFAAWRRLDAQTLEIGTGSDRVLVRIAADGGAIAVTSETIEETLPAGRKPVRLGIDFTSPVARGRISVHVTRAAPLLAVPAAASGAPRAILANLSTLGAGRAPDAPLVAGFTLGGGSSASVLVRAVGPGLEPFGVTGTFADPRLVLHGARGEWARNDDWTAAAGDAAARIGAFPLRPASRDAAAVFELPAGSYTVQVDGANEASGVGLVEVYAAGSGDARLVNLSTRALLAPGEVLTLGLVVAPGAPRWFLLRGVGPGLVPFGVANALADPTLRLYQAQTGVAQNDDWHATYWAAELVAAAASVAAFELPSGSADAALLVELPAGSYTLQVAGKGATSGSVLGEVYELR